ncbi:tetratricopeptide repeat protein [Oceanobacillus kimchii]|uniref:tetratricopeptide repeat protein n=1 Tax=Oceanobacillus kimchii TaxID=746691 RepID=UPI0021A2BB5B|nr:tetratricopeptide repeat protein [Oceanobacillus kimchii]MCT1575749.1 tetratricopeptide repeat protein [Oceanobacillus kimchii]MCT2135386.1 tetratricopeptide repeat protein [Oceanobacillus kimchii]
MSYKEVDNVVLFPSVKKTLEDESLRALQEKRYEEALDKLNHLIEYHASSHEIYIGKLMCLMELGNYKDAQDLCEELTANKDEHYYHYLHIYLTILFQTSQYEILMEQVEYEFEQNNVPELLREPFQQLYEMSQSMKIDIQNDYSSIHIDELHQAINQDQHKKQWQLIKKIRALKVSPTSDMYPLLENSQIHPVVKTSIMQWLVDCKVSETISIHKFDVSLDITPNQISKIKDLHEYQLAKKELEIRMVNNPSMQQLIEQLIYRYFYVIYPFKTLNEELDLFISAAINLAKRYLQMDIGIEEISEDVKKWMDSIQMCDSLYLSIIEE